MNVVNLGLLDYEKALSIQEKLNKKRIENAIEDTLLIVEHPPVLTLGRKGEYSNILINKDFLKKNGIDIYEINRGGDVTYHGPGQIVGYPIIDLQNYGKDLKKYVEMVEEVFISLLKSRFNINAHREEKKYTGVWVDDEKITAIGIAVRKWVSMHGFAFNVNTNLDHFRWINPCGITDKGVTSLKKLTGGEQDYHDITELVINTFCNVFQSERKDLKVSELEELLNGNE
ncbi:MAG: lipoyl(octanoyl) transferase LipB [Clostridiales bacterium]|nr:lipoyl(octanoyl) transferase LipB [Clostridiales bacterium]